MDILTLELFDVTVSEALREISRGLGEHPGLPLRILVGGEEMLLHNIQRHIVRCGRTASTFRENGHWRLELNPEAALAPAPPREAPPRDPVPAPVPVRAQAPIPAPVPAAALPRPLLLTRASLGGVPGGMGRRLLLGVLRELDPQVPWVGLTLEALELLEDPEALETLRALRDRGTPVRISRECLLFPDGPEDAFETMADSQWQRLAGKGDLTIL